MGSNLFILTQLFSCHLVRFSHNCGSCSPNYHAARNRLTACRSVMTMSFPHSQPKNVGPVYAYMHIPGRVSKAAQEQVASHRALLRVLQLLSPYPKGSQTSRSKRAQKEPRHNPNSTQENWHDCSAQFILLRQQQQKKEREKRPKIPKIRPWHQKLVCQGGRHTHWGRRLIFLD